jgi:uncharacterized membrane protein YGL010W
VTFILWDIMDNRSLRMFNDTAIMVVMAIVLYSLFYLRQEVLWGIILAVLTVLFMAYVNISNKDKTGKRS